MKLQSFKEKFQDRMFMTVVYVSLTLLVLVSLYPVIYVLSASFSSADAISSGSVILWPVKFSTKAYDYVFHYKDIWVGYGNSLFYTIVGTAINLAATLPCAYALSRKDMPGRGLIMVLFLITNYFSGGMIPAYMNLFDLGLLNTRWALLLPGMVSVFNLIVARTYFASSIPWELHEAAFIDGCNDAKTFVKIILPLSKPLIGVQVLYYAVAHWNSYFQAMIYLEDRNLMPLQVFLREILAEGEFSAAALQSGGSFSIEEMSAMIQQTETATVVKYAMIVVSTVPIMILFPFVQKYFEKGIMIGAVKG